MRFKFLCASAFFVLAVASAQAQAVPTTAGKCSKPDLIQTVPAGDKDGHMFMIQSGKCTTTSAVNGVKSKEGVFAEHDDAMGTHLRGWGVYVETFESGDKIFYNYQTTATTKDNAIVTGSNKYQVTGGTGKMKGMKGSGGCTLKGTADGGLDYSCTGEWVMPSATPTK